MILALELVILLYIKRDRATMAAIGTLTVFTALMIIFQMLFGSSLEVALTGGLRMFVMTTAFLCLLASTKIQDISQALVEKFHMPYEYAFMLTTALRLYRISCQTAPSPLTPSPVGGIPTAAMP